MTYTPYRGPLVWDFSWGRWSEPDAVSKGAGGADALEERDILVELGKAADYPNWLKETIKHNRLLQMAMAGGPDWQRITRILRERGEEVATSDIFDLRNASTEPVWVGPSSKRMWP